MFNFVLVKKNLCSYDFPSSPESPPEVTIKRDVAKKVYTNKSLTNNNDTLQSIQSQIHSKLNKSKNANTYSGSKVLKRKVSDSSSLSSSSQVKRGPGRPKKVLKDYDCDNNNDDSNVKEKRLKLDCSSKIKHKTSSSSSSDLSPPVLEPWSPFSPRKDSTRTPPTLSPVSSALKLSDAPKSSDEEKYFAKKTVKKRSPSSILVCD